VTSGITQLFGFLSQELACVQSGLLSELKALVYSRVEIFDKLLRVELRHWRIVLAAPASGLFLGRWRQSVDCGRKASEKDQ
jgi:hypothetical protein